MPIDENVLFKTIFEKRGDQPIEQVMMDVARAKAAYVQAEMELAAKGIGDQKPVLEISSEADDQSVVADEKAEPELKRLTKRNLKYSPATAITDDYIQCCLCGAKFKALTSRHLKLHGTTPDLYRKLCDYDEKQILMSHTRAVQMQETIKKAQASRKGVAAPHQQSANNGITFE